jgi:hypothetical protein
VIPEDLAVPASLVTSIFLTDPVYISYFNLLSKFLCVFFIYNCKTDFNILVNEKLEIMKKRGMVDNLISSMYYLM